MNILHISETTMAYAPARFVDLINRYTQHKAKLIQMKDFFLGNPLNVPIIKDIGEVEEAFKWADVLHFHGTNIFNRRRVIVENQLLRIEKFLTKPFVLEYHGSPQRENFVRNQKSLSCLIVSTPEMLPLFKGSRFFPNLIDENDNNLYPLAEYLSDNPELSEPTENQGLSGSLQKIKLCHHYSMHRRVKDTNSFLNAKNQLQIEGNNKYQLDILPRLNLAEACRERAKYHVIFDHCQGYYGIISLEGMVQGLLVMNACGEKVVQGLATNSMDALQEFFGHRPPFFYTAPRTIIQDIKKLTFETIKDFGIKGREFMKNIWSGKININRLIDIYISL
jgi:hypothetical protein